MTQLLVRPLDPCSEKLAGAPVPETPTRHWVDLARFSVVAAEFGLLVWIIRLFELESVRFANLAILAWIGFLIHHFLPLQLRVPFFALLSIAGLKLVAGGMVTLWVTGVGLGLIAICHLPIPFILRIGILGVLACLLAALRGGWIARAS